MIILLPNSIIESDELYISSNDYGGLYGNNDHHNFEYSDEVYITSILYRGGFSKFTIICKSYYSDAKEVLSEVYSGNGSSILPLRYLIENNNKFKIIEKEFLKT